MTITISPLAAGILLAALLLLVFVVARAASASKVVTKVVKSAEDEAMDLVEKQIDILTDPTRHLKAIEAANKALADQQARANKLFSKVAVLVQAAPAQPPFAIPVGQTGGVANA